MEKKQKNEDWISELPDCVLGNIVSRLNMKDVVKTRVLSRRWRHVYTHRTSIHISFYNMFNKWPRRILYRECFNSKFYMAREKFCERADQMMALFRGEEKSITCLRVDMFMDARCSSHIDDWIRIAVGSGVKKIELLLSPSWIFTDVYKIEEHSKYRFPCWLFLLGQTMKSKMLQYLHLHTCVLHAPSVFRGFTCLKVLKLQYSLLGKDFATNLFSLMCPQLEDLTLDYCKLESDYFKITSPHLMHLKVIFLKNSPMIEIFAMNLVTFEYSGDSKRLCLLKAPKLERIFTWPSPGQCLSVLFMLPTIPLLETLTLNLTEKQVMIFPESIGVLINLKQLSIYICGYSKNTRLFRVLSLLMASPLVHKFVVMLSALKSPSGRSEENQDDECMTFRHHHHPLKEFAVYGCAGNSNEIEFVKYVLKIASCLEHIVLGPLDKVYCGNGRWRNLFKGGCKNFLSPCCFEREEEKIREKLQDYISPTVQFVML